MWRVHMIALKSTQIVSKVNLLQPACVSRLLSSRADCCRLPRVDVSRVAPRSMSSLPKGVRAENMSATKIGTHNGTFHCDEVLACFFLRQLPEYKDAEIIRTRDPTKLSECDIVVDVGGEFDPKRHRYDHHQRTFAESFHSLCAEKPWVTKLSSAGLVYLHFGRQLLMQLTQLPEGDRQLEVLYDKLYENFVEEVDAVDNGISQCDGEARYSVSSALSARVGHLNPRWNSESQDTEEGFRKALKMVGEEFLDRLEYYRSAWLPARALVEEAVKGRHQVDPSGELVLFSQGGFPWKEHLFSVEKELKVETPIKFVLYSDQNGQWRVQCVPAGLNTFQNRLSLLEEWRGVRDEALSELSGIKGCVFVHAGGFIGGNKSQEGALEMARRTLQAAARSPASGDS
ncbi:MYG1 exonuclease [Spinachia spinachia]